METETIIEVTDEHTDNLGHLNHVAAVRFLELSRGDWYSACRLFSGEFGRLGTVVVNINYDYRRECFKGERLRVLCRGESMGTKSMVLAHEIVKPDGQVAVAGRATSVVMDLDVRGIIPIPECVARHLAPRDKAGTG